MATLDELRFTAEQIAATGVLVERRDELIRRARAEGASLRTIAGAAGLSWSAVRKITMKGLEL